MLLAPVPNDKGHTRHIRLQGDHGHEINYMFFLLPVDVMRGEVEQYVCEKSHYKNYINCVN